jgi:hypothetical protein
MFSGTRCHVCGKALEADGYAREFDIFGMPHGLYWANPKLSEYTDVRLDFCGPQHSFEWHQQKREEKEAGEVVAHDNDPEQSQPSPTD